MFIDSCGLAVVSFVVCLVWGLLFGLCSTFDGWVRCGMFVITNHKIWWDAPSTFLHTEKNEDVFVDTKAYQGISRQRHQKICSLLKRYSSRLKAIVIIALYGHRCVMGHSWSTVSFISLSRVVRMYLESRVKRQTNQTQCYNIIDSNETKSLMMPWLR